MYYLKTIDGSRTRFQSLTQLFEFIEKDVGAVNAVRNYIQAHLLRVIGENFNSTTEVINRGFEDTRNRACSLHHQYSSLRGLSIARRDNRWYYHHQLTDGEKCVWLATSNKYIVLDAFGRVVSKKLIAERYQQRFNELHKKNSRWQTVNVPIYGTKRAKDWKKGINKLYRGFPLCKDELKAMTSKDEFDVQFNLRQSRQNTVRALNLQYESRYDEYTRSWKDQSKKKKQWM